MHHLTYFFMYKRQKHWLNHFCESLPRLQVMTEVSKFSNQLDNEIDYNLPIRSNCKYFTVNEVRNLKNKNNFNIFHSNINGL